MRHRIDIFKSRHFKPVGFDENLVIRKRKISHEMAVIWRCMGVINGYWRWMLLTIFLGLLWSTLGVLFPWLDKLVYDRVFPEKDWNLFWFIVIAWIFIDLQGMVIRHISAALSTYLNIRAGLWLQIHFYRKVQQLSLTHIYRRGIGEHMYRMWDDVVGVLTIAQFVISSLITEVYEVLMSILFLSLIDPSLAAIGIGVTLFNSIAAWIYTTWRRKIEFMKRSANEKSHSRLQEGISGALTVKVFGRINHEVASYLHTVTRLMRVSSFFVFVSQLYYQTTGAVGMIKGMIINGVLFYQVIKGNISYGMILVIIPYLNRLDDPIETVIKTINNLRNKIAPAERFFQTWDKISPVADLPGAIKVKKLLGEIKVENVNFSYEDNHQILKNVNLDVKPGEFLAIVGHSGSGKSTLLNLLLRLYDPDQGKVSFDGKDLCYLKQNSLLKRIGVVLQDTFIFKGTIWENLHFSESSASENKMIETLDEVQLGKLIRSLPEGIDTDLKEGSKLSVGERQRIGIARALLRDPDIWILDEPTSSLDLRTEKDIMELLTSVRKGQTTIMVTHRLNTLSYADRIVYMQDGQILEEGTLQQLIALKGGFYRMHSLFHHGADEENTHVA